MVRRQAAFRLWMANLVVAAIVGVNYLAHVSQVDSLKTWLFALLALVSTALALTLIPGLLFMGLAHLWRSTRGLGLCQAFVWSVFQGLLFADTRIYNIFRYHFNGQVLNLVYTRGSEDAIHLGWQVWTTIGVGLVAALALQLWYWRRMLERSMHAVRRSGRERVLRPAMYWAAVLLPAVFVEKTIYAHSGLTRDRQITHLARIFPLYPRLPMDGLAETVLGVEMPRAPKVELGSLALDYPHARPAVDPEGARPNVLVLVVDCLRRDRLDPEYMPNASRWASDSRRFENHLSGGNSTRFGLFSMLYGLHGSYWFPFLNQRRGPVLIDTLAELDYEFGIFGSASMNYPELRDTIWAGIPDDVHDTFPSREAWERDGEAADALIEWLTERAESDAPFFGFLLLDSPHQTYSHPPGLTPFTPSSPDLDYLEMTKNDGPEPDELEAVRNRYNNAVFYSDQVVGRILEAVDASGLSDDTIVVLTGDHGEEFREHGFFGHTSAYTLEQVAVPFLMKGPGIEAGSETRPTSHLDFAPTLLELMGANPAGRDQWTLGANLFDPPLERRRVIGGWNELGVWTPDGILRVPLSLFEFDIELYDYDWRHQPDDASVLAGEAETLEALGAACNRFLR